MFWRDADTWQSRLFDDSTTMLDLPEIAVQLPLAEVYDGLTFPPPGD